MPTPLGGETPFFLDPNYLEKTKKDLALTSLPSPSYTYETEKKVWRVVKMIFAIIIFPIGIYFLIHVLIGKFALLPASRGDTVKGLTHTDLRKKLLEEHPYWRFKRLSIDVNGDKIDLMIVGKEKEFYKRKVILFPLGRNECYEYKILHAKGFKEILEKVGGIAVVPNYKGVGASKGFPTAKGMVETIRASYKFIEDRLQAKEIVTIAHSIGCAIDAEVLLKHPLKQDIKYTFIRRSGFSSYAEAAETYITKKAGKPFGLLAYGLVRLFGWNVSTLSSSLELKEKEIIIQSMKDGRIVHDGVVGKEASLAYHIQKNKQQAKGEKHIYGVDLTHDESISDFSPIVALI